MKNTNAPSGAKLGLRATTVAAHSLYASYNKSFSPYGGRGLLSVDVMSAKVVEDKSVPANVGKSLLNTAERNGNLFLRYAPASAG